MIATFTLFLGLIAGYYIDPNPTSSASGKAPNTAKCIGVLDGDTIKVEWNGNIENVRILGIDCPETKKNSRFKQQLKKMGIKEIELITYGKIAKKTSKNWLFNFNVRLVFPSDDVKRNSFGRLLAYVEQQGVDIGERLLLGGNAMLAEWEHPRWKTYELFQKEAIKNKKGIWRTYVPPPKKRSGKQKR